MISRRTGTRITTWAGFWAAALLWAANMQLGQILPARDCMQQVHVSALISSTFTMLALLAGWVSWRAAGTDPTGFGSPRTLRFEATVSALAALIFAFALALQAVASWMLTGCER
jgi:hypothetical protein